MYIKHRESRQEPTEMDNAPVVYLASIRRSFKPPSSFTTQCCIDGLAHVLLLCLASSHPYSIFMAPASFFLSFPGKKLWEGRDGWAPMRRRIFNWHFDDSFPPFSTPALPFMKWNVCAVCTGKGRSHYGCGGSRPFVVWASKRITRHVQGSCQALQANYLLINQSFSFCIMMPPCSCQTLL